MPGGARLLSPTVVALALVAAVVAAVVVAAAAAAAWWKKEKTGREGGGAAFSSGRELFQKNELPSRPWSATNDAVPRRARLEERRRSPSAAEFSSSEFWPRHKKERARLQARARPGTNTLKMGPQNRAPIYLLLLP